MLDKKTPSAYSLAPPLNPHDLAPDRDSKVRNLLVSLVACLAFIGSSAKEVLAQPLTYSPSKIIFGQLVTYSLPSNLPGTPAKVVWTYK